MENTASGGNQNTPDNTLVSLVEKQILMNAELRAQNQELLLQLAKAQATPPAPTQTGVTGSVPVHAQQSHKTFGTILQKEANTPERRKGLAEQWQGYIDDIRRRENRY